MPDAGPRRGGRARRTMRVLGGTDDRPTRGPARHVPVVDGLETPLLAGWVDEVPTGATGGWGPPPGGPGW